MPHDLFRWMSRPVWRRLLVGLACVLAIASLIKFAINPDHLSSAVGWLGGLLTAALVWVCLSDRSNSRDHSPARVARPRPESSIGRDVVDGLRKEFGSIQTASSSAPPLIAPELECCLLNAVVEARKARHEFIALEHLLLVLLDDPSTAKVLQACACNIEDLRKTLRHYVADNTPVLPLASQAAAQPTPGFQRVIQRAIMHVVAASKDKREVTGADVLVAMFGETDSRVLNNLHQQGVTLDIVKSTLAGTGRHP